MTLTEDQYHREVLEQSFHLFRAVLEDYYADEVTEADLSSAVVDNSHHVLDAHDWFNSDRGAAFYGAVIEYAQESGISVQMRHDLETHLDHTTPDRVLQTLAHLHFRRHVERKCDSILD